MKINAYLFINNEGNFRITKRHNYPTTNEIGICLNIDIPDSFFSRPFPSAKITVPDDYFANPTPELVTHLIAPEIAKSLKLEVANVQDGLMRMLESKHAELKTIEDQ